MPGKNLDFVEKILDEAPSLIAVFDKSLIVQVWNKFCEDYTSVKKEDILGKPFFDVIPSLRKLGWEKIFRRVIETGEPFEKRDYKMTRTFGPHKGERWYQNIFLKPIFEDGEVTGIVEIIEDVTERKKAKEGLKNSEENYRRFLQNFRGITYQGDMYFKPMFFHGNVKEITGYSGDEFLTRKVRWDQLIHPDDVQEIIKLAEKIRTIPEPGVFHYQQNLDGT
jgi:PAS domain S-box-containing protein